MMVVSHRGPFRFTEQPDGSFLVQRGAGGVVSALGPLLHDRDPAVKWVAAAMSDGDRAAVRAGAARAEGFDLELLDLDPAQHRMHYDVVSNGVLWFLLHGLFDLVRRPRFDHRFREAWSAYEAVNQRFSDAILDRADDGDVVLVQDYQLFLVPKQVKDQRPDLRVVHFTHTPFAGPDAMRILPRDVAEAVCMSLAGVPAGFHTARWGRTYAAAARDVLGVGPRWFAASLGVDATALEEVASSPAGRAAAESLEAEIGDRAVVIRSDRVEPSKNIVRGFLAYERLLETRPSWRERVVFIAMLYMSRGGMPEYLAYGNEVEQTVARINERFATRDWSPIVLDLRDDFARSVAGLQRYDVLLVNPVRDGLNLVAKEGALLNQRDGVVCLSPEAGAYEELAPAVEMAHPYDLEQVANALDRALSLPPEERAARARALKSLAAARTPSQWLDDQLEQAR